MMRMTQSLLAQTPQTAGNEPRPPGSTTPDHSLPELPQVANSAKAEGKVRSLHCVILLLPNV